MGAIKKCRPNKKQFLSPFFLVRKPNGKNRFILNLKHLNTFITAPHFKIEDHRTVLKLITDSCFFCSIDLKDAYFSLAVKDKYQRYLRFCHEGQTYQFTCLPFGLNIAPYIFTKITRPILKYFRERNILCSAYLDDFIIIANTYTECLKNTNVVYNLLSDLGFNINYSKCKLTPSQEITYLGFTINSIKMTIRLPEERKNKVLGILKLFLNKKSCYIRDFAKLLGTLVATKPAVKYGWLHLKSMEREKHIALSLNNNSYSAKMALPRYIKTEILWWMNNIPISKKPIKEKPFRIEIFTDASNTGWGANCGRFKTHGFWNENEKQCHINYLELLAAFNGLKTFAKHLSNENILLRIDNITAIASINKMGSVRFKKLNDISHKIWQWCESKNNFIHAAYISSSKNVIADSESRITNTNTEYELSKDVFQKIINILGTPNIDLFASYQNTKCEKFISWQPDPESMCVDAFTVNWKAYYFYAFPPFSLIGRVLEKIVLEKASGILVVPDWPSQFWYPRFKDLLTSEPLKFSYFDGLILSPFRSTLDHLQNITLVAGKLYGGRLLKEAHQR